MSPFVRVIANVGFLNATFWYWKYKNSHSFPMQLRIAKIVQKNQLALDLLSNQFFLLYSLLRTYLILPSLKKQETQWCVCDWVNFNQTLITQSPLIRTRATKCYFSRKIINYFQMVRRVFNMNDFRWLTRPLSRYLGLGKSGPSQVL